MKLRNFCFILVLGLSLFACGGGQQGGGGAIMPGPDAQKQILKALIEAKDSSTILLGEGKFDLTGSLSIEGKKNVTFKGAGKDKTFLSFKNQTSGAEGIIAQNCENFTVRDLRVEDTKGDGIKVQKTKGANFISVAMVWTGKPDSGNGAYGLYPVNCEGVLIEDSYIRGASDAGIYVGQSTKAIVRKNKVEENVAGIEIENTVDAEVTMNEVENNTGGIMVFDLPNLPVKNGSNVRVFRNMIKNNNHPNFSSKGITVYMVPAGVGFMVMATNNVEVYENYIHGHRSISIAAVTYDMMGKPLTDKDGYDPTLAAINIYRNDIKIAKDMIPDTTRDVGKLIYGAETAAKTKFGVMLQGDYAKANMKDGKPLPDKRICLRENVGDLTFMNISNPKDEYKNYDCSLESVKSFEYKPVTQ